MALTNWKVHIILAVPGILLRESHGNNGNSMHFHLQRSLLKSQPPVYRHGHGARVHRKIHGLIDRPKGLARPPPQLTGNTLALEVASNEQAEKVGSITQCNDASKHAFYFPQQVVIAARADIASFSFR